MSTKAKKSDGQDQYMMLIREFPLRPIRTEAERDAAGKVMEKVAVREGRLAAGESDYLDVLSDLIEAYDETRWPMPRDRGTPTEKLRYLLDQSGLSPKDLAKLLDCSATLVSLMLNGKRDLSKANVVVLAKHFKIEAGYFL